MVLFCVLNSVQNSQAQDGNEDPASLLNFNHTYSDGFEDNIVVWQKRLDRNLTILRGEIGGVVSWSVSDPSVLVLPSQLPTEERIYENTTFPMTIRVVIGGRFPGREHLIVKYRPPGGITTEAARHEVSCITGQGILTNIATYVFIGWLIVSYVTMGCKMDIKTIWSKLNPPAGVIIGLCCQFFIMPGLAYSLGKMFELDDPTSIGLILVGTCPGGWISNVLTILFDCDFVLSLTMTSFSTVIAMGMMPLNLFIYVQTIIGVDENLQTPFVELVVQLIMLIAPLGVGVLLSMKWPSLQDRAEKLMKPFATILVLVAVGLGIPTQIYTFFVEWRVWVVSLLLPLIGAFFGLAIARIVNQNYKASTTIAFETACQNALLAKTMATLFYPQPESDLIGILPLLVAVLTAVEGIVAAIIFTGIKKIRERRRQNRESDEDKLTMTDIQKSKPEENGTSTLGNNNPAYSV
ncbi:ileal sodium/bile acid cotransporter-like [Amphiura filiformis]|uniref:ileal sodium/bile acid cotransporter-like n=1 Tax=Amphiura filiformis TaxID=82378 RepID=UPI003B21E437